jgi:predicted nucleic acid-binding Zn ribbon protein
VVSGASMALSMQGAFAQARQGKLERRRRGIQRELSSAAELAGMLGAKQTAAAVAEAEAAHAAAHARDFTTKQWHQQVGATLVHLH